LICVVGVFKYKTVDGHCVKLYTSKSRK